MTRSEAAQWERGLAGRRIEDELLMPIVMYRIARAAAIEERDRLTVDELATAVCT